MVECGRRRRTGAGHRHTVGVGAHPRDVELGRAGVLPAAAALTDGQIAVGAAAAVRGAHDRGVVGEAGELLLVLRTQCAAHIPDDASDFAVGQVDDRGQAGAQVIVRVCHGLIVQRPSIAHSPITIRLKISAVQSDALTIGVDEAFLLPNSPLSVHSHPHVAELLHERPVVRGDNAFNCEQLSKENAARDKTLAVGEQ